MVFTGLHVGAPIATDTGNGGVGCILSRHGVPQYFLTAGHLFPAGAPGATVRAGMGTTAQVTVGRLVTNLLDVQQPHDAALVKLTTEGVQLARASVARGQRFASVAAYGLCFGIGVRAVRPTIGRRSRAVLSHADPRPEGLLTSIARPAGFRVRGVVETPKITQPRDSGSALVCDEVEGVVVGFCIGELGDRSLFEPVSRALVRLPDEIQSLELWP